MYNTINGWTKDKMIEYVKKNFKGKSYDRSTKTCFYRKDGGKKCAVGLFIPNKLYHNSMERQSIRAIHNEELNKFMPLELEGMVEFQVKHDNSNSQSTKRELIKWINENVK